MRHTLLLILAAAALPAVSLAQASAAPKVVNMDIRGSLDDLGDGRMELTFKMNAQQWATWKQQYGSNPSMFKRDMSKFFTQYDVTDFKLEQNDMQREAVVTVAASGMAEYLGDGIFELEIEKGMGKSEHIGDELRFNYTQPAGPGTLQLVDQRMRLPGGAKHVEETTNSQGDQVVRYELDVRRGGPPYLLIGVLSGILGACLLGASFVATERR